MEAQGEKNTDNNAVEGGPRGHILSPLWLGVATAWKMQRKPPPQMFDKRSSSVSRLFVSCCRSIILSTQALNEALEELTFTPDANSNALNTDDLASITLTVKDLGLSGEGGPQESEPLSLHLVFDATNDGPLLVLPDSFAAQEDVPLLMSGISVSDIDYNEPGGEALFLELFDRPADLGSFHKMTLMQSS